MNDVLLKDLIDIPTSVHKSDFVVSLEDGVSDPERILDTYVVTEQLTGAFDHALSLIATSVTDRASKGAYLHGSFGSGKSHFMSVLNLLLQGNTRARAIPELSRVVAKHDELLQGRNFLLVPYHMIGAASMEAGVLGGYINHIRKLHPEAPLPSLYLDDGLLANAENIRERMGDDAFFESLGSVASGLEGFGSLAAGWDAVSYDAAASAPPDDPERQRLVSDLINVFFDSTHERAAASGQGYVEFANGLSAISRHAKSLGYDGVVLFLDELILWFASRMADPSFAATEGQKLAKLVEAAREDRPVPIVSFIARQRDLREFIGQGVPGAEKLNFGDTLEWWESRFDTIELADRNLAAIVERRILKPKSDAARSQIDAAFEQTAASATGAMSSLLTHDADRAEFRRVYPFSPALIDALVALSAFLQRERTALRLLMQLLTERRDELAIGDLVPLGDLFDVIRDGEEPLSDELKRHFQTARKLYDQRLRPMLLASHGLTEHTAASADANHPFTTDDRLAKTLLIAALVPDAEPVRGLTARRLADLNHGTIKTLIPGEERAAVVAKLRQWSSEVGELRTEGDEHDPSVSLRLSGVDVDGLIDRASNVDTNANRRRVIRELLTELLSVQDDGALTASTYDLEWRGSRRTVDVRFGTVGSPEDLPDGELRANGVPRVIVGIPFDEGQASRRDAVVRLERLREEQAEPTPVIAWLPQFLTDEAQDRLGQYVTINQLLTGDAFTSATTHLSPQDRSEARHLLENQRQGLRTQLEDMLRMAYGITKPDARWVGDDLPPADQVHSLLTTLRLQPPVGAGLKDGFTHLLDQLLRHMYPEHPTFDALVTPGELRTALRWVESAAADPDRRVEIPRPDRRAVRKLLGPLKIATTGEAHIQLSHDWVEQFHIAQQREGITVPTVGQLKGWIDQSPGPWGLEARVANLIICAYAIMDDRVMVEDGVVREISIDRLPDDVQVRQQRLPSETAWKDASDLANRVFGVPVSPVRSAAAVAQLAQELNGLVADLRDSTTDLVQALDRPSGDLNVGDDAPRRQTAVAGRDLVSAMYGTEPVPMIEHLATVQPPTSAEALGRSLKSAADVVGVIERTNWELLGQAIQLTGEWVVQADGLRQRLVEALNADELTVGLSDALARAQSEATDLLGRAAKGAMGDDASAGDQFSSKRPGVPTDEPGQGAAQSWTLTRSGQHTELRGDDARRVLRELLERADELRELDVRWDFTE